MYGEMFYSRHTALRQLLWSLNNLRRRSFGNTGNLQLENSRLGLIESVCERYWKMQHPILAQTSSQVKKQSPTSSRQPLDMTLIMLTSMSNLISQSGKINLIYMKTIHFHLIFRICPITSWHPSLEVLVTCVRLWNSMCPTTNCRLCQQR